MDWGDIDGTLSNQTDLQTALNNKQPLASALTTLSSSTAAGLALMDDADNAAQRTTLGLGSASTLNVGTTAGTVAAGNDSRLSDARTPTAHAASHVTGGSDAIQSATASQPGLATAAQITKLDGIEALADVTDAANVGSAIHGATAKTTPVDADTVPLIDSAASNVLKKLSWANVKATLKTYFDALYVTGPSSAADNALVRYDGTTGKLVQSSAATITDAGTLTVSSADAQVVASSTGGDAKLESSAATLGLVWQFDPGVEGFGVQTVRIKPNTTGTESFDLILPQEVGTVGQVLAINSISAPDVNLIWASPAGGGDALTTNPLSQFASTTSDQLRGVISDETGSGALVFANSPTLVTPALGTPSSGTLTNCTGLPTAGLVDDAVTLAKMAVGTAGNLITYDASGNPSAVATGTAGQRLTSNGTGAAPTFQSEALRIPIFFSDQTTDWTTGLKVTFTWRFGTTTLSSTPIDCVTAPTGSAAQFDVKKNGATIYSTKPTIDASETSTGTAATPAVLSTTSLANGDIVTIHIDQVGSTIKGQGGVLTFVGTTIP